VRFGSPLSAGFGSPENDVAFVNIKPGASGSQSYQLTFQPAAGKGDAWFGVYCNDHLVKNVYAAGGTPALPYGPLQMTAPAGATDLALAIIRLGQLSDPGYHIERVAQTFEANTCQRVTLNWTWTPEILGAVGDDGYTSAWSLSGVSYSATNAGGTPALPADWSEFTFDISDWGGTCTVSLYRQNTLVAQGSVPAAALPATVSLAAVGGSGISGSVAVGAGVIVELGAQLLMRWPAAMLILRSAGGTPALPGIDSVPFNNADAAEWTEPTDLAAGTYYYRLQPLSDTGEPGSPTSTLTAVVQGPPLPPAGLHYVSGGAGVWLTDDFSSATWTLASCTSANSAADPLGGSAAFAITATGDGWMAEMLQSRVFAAPAGVWTLKVFLKAISYDPGDPEKGWCDVVRTQGTNAAEAEFNLITGAVQYASDCTAAIVDAGNGWWLCTMASTAPAAAAVEYDIYPAHMSGEILGIFNLSDTATDQLGTTIAWTASATPGAGYNLYTAPDGSPFALNDPDQTLAAGVTTATLSAFASYPGKRNVLLRALSAGTFTPSPGLIAHWKMNDNAGTPAVADNIGGYNGTAQQNTSDLHQTGKIDGALSFNGHSSNSVTIPPPPQSVFENDYSFAAWVYIGSTDPNQSILGAVAAAWVAGSLDFCKAGPAFQFTVNSADNSIQCSVVSNNTYGIGWHHVVAGRDKTNGKIFIYVDDTDYAEAPDTTGTTPTVLNIKMSELCGYDFQGLLDDVRLYTKKLLQADVDALWNGGNGTETDGTLNAGIEEKNLNVLSLEYDASGNYVPPRPNTAGIDPGSIAITAGRSLALTGLYSTVSEAGVATALQLFSRTPAGAYDFSSPDATAALVAGWRDGMKQAALAKTYGSDGLRYVCTVAVTAGGVQGAPSPEILIDPNADAMPAPANATAVVARG